MLKGRSGYLGMALALNDSILGEPGKDCDDIIRDLNSARLSVLKLKGNDLVWGAIDLDFLLIRPTSEFKLWISPLIPLGAKNFGILGSLKYLFASESALFYI